MTQSQGQPVMPGFGYDPINLLDITMELIPLEQISVGDATKKPSLNTVRHLANFGQTSVPIVVEVKPDVFQCKTECNVVLAYHSLNADPGLLNLIAFDPKKVRCQVIRKGWTIPDEVLALALETEVSKHGLDTYTSLLEAMKTQAPPEIAAKTGLTLKEQKRLHDQFGPLTDVSVPGGKINLLPFIKTGQLTVDNGKRITKISPQDRVMVVDRLNLGKKVSADDIKQMRREAAIESAKNKLAGFLSNQVAPKPIRYAVIPESSIAFLTEDAGEAQKYIQDVEEKYPDHSGKLLFVKIVE